MVGRHLAGGKGGAEAPDHGGADLRRAPDADRPVERAQHRLAVVGVGGEEFRRGKLVAEERGIVMGGRRAADETEERQIIGGGRLRLGEARRPGEAHGHQRRLEHGLHRQAQPDIDRQGQRGQQLAAPSRATVRFRLQEGHSHRLDLLSPSALRSMRRYRLRRAWDKHACASTPVTASRSSPLNSIGSLDANDFLFV